MNEDNQRKQLIKEIEVVDDECKTADGLEGITDNGTTIIEIQEPERVKVNTYDKPTTR